MDELRPAEAELGRQPRAHAAGADHGEDQEGGDQAGHYQRQLGEQHDETAAGEAQAQQGHEAERRDDAQHRGDRGDAQAEPEGVAHHRIAEHRLEGGEAEAPLAAQPRQSDAAEDELQQRGDHGDRNESRPRQKQQEGLDAPAPAADDASPDLPAGAGSRVGAAMSVLTRDPNRRQAPRPAPAAARPPFRRYARAAPGHARAAEARLAPSRRCSPGTGRHR